MDIKLYKKDFSGKKELTGELVKKEGDAVSVLIDAKERVFDIKDIALIRLHIDF